MPDARFERERVEILKHARLNGRYLGDGPEMRSLVADGLMRCVGKLSWCPDEIFKLTPAGAEYLRDTPARRSVESM